MEKHGSDENLVQNTGQGIISAFSQLYPILTDGGERRGSVGAEGRVVVSYDADISGDVKPELLAVKHGSVGNLVMAADNGGHSHVKKTGKVLFDTLDNMLGSAGTGGICFQPVLPHGMEKSLVSLLHDIGAQGAAQITDPAVAQIL